MLFFWLPCFPKLKKQRATCERFTECPSAKEAKNELQDRGTAHHMSHTPLISRDTPITQAAAPQG